MSSIEPNLANSDSRVGALADALASRYRLERELGAGGMAKVYLAEDLRHHRRVAVKVLRAELTASVGVDRFVQEIEIVARLRHPHILPLYDSGDAAELLYYVMPYVDGESLRARLAREGQLPVDDAVRFTREIADALAYAHAHDVVHRDIKPENVLLESGHAVVADFGIARALSAATADGAHDRLTATGVSIGTPTYMSPEQGAGDRDVDGRSDIYSLGCVLYEMLGGVPPFTGPTMASVIRQHLTSEPAPITERRAALPDSVVDAVSRALAKDPADRFGTAAEFAQSIAVPATAVGARHTRRTPKLRKRVVAAAVGLVALAAAAWALRDRVTRASESAAATTAAIDQKHVVAVMPFENLSPDSANAYFASGIAEEVTSELSRISALRILSRAAIAPLLTAPDRLRRLSDELGVGSIVDGSVRVHGDSARVIATVTDARTGQLLTTREEDRALRDALSVQAELARFIAEALQARLTPAEMRRRGRSPTVSLEAYDLYFRAARLPAVNPAQNRDAMALLRRALALDPGFARAHYALALRYLFLAYGRGAAYADSGIAEARAAIAADPELAHGYFILGTLQSFTGHFAEGRKSFLEALELDPNHAPAMTDLAVNEDLAGRYDESLHWAARAFPLAPNSPDGSWYHIEGALLRIGNDAFNERYFRDAAARYPNSVRLALNIPRLDVLRGRDSAAMAGVRSVLERNPSNQEARYFAAELATVTGAPDAATFIEPLVHEAPEGRGDFLAESFRTQLARLLAQRGERARADSLWDASAALARRQLASKNESSQLPMELAAISAIRGDTAAALASLEQAYEMGWKDPRILALDPFFAGLRQHPAFRAIAAKMQADLETMRRTASAAHPELFAVRR